MLCPMKYEKPGRAVDAPVNPLSRRRYARMFPGLARFTAEDAFRYALGRRGGICDCGAEHDDLASEAEGAAGWPIFGQFIAHDITADRSSPAPRTDVHALENARTPQLNLECLYGDGPAGHPFLYSRDDGARFLLGDDDVLRNREGIAIIGDPRNDSHVFMSQMHLAFIHAHNAFVDRARAAGTPDAKVFETAARDLRWHYQTVVLREFLPLLIGAEMTASLLEGDRRFYRPDGQAFMPLEFADAAYRYGHSQIRHTYTLRNGSEPIPIFPNLLGFRPVPPEHRVDWTQLFDADGHPPAQRAKKIDGRLVRGLIELPVALTGECEVEEFHSLAVRDLQRGQGVGLPSGEAVARRVGEAALTADEVGAANAGWPGETPLWYYILREADVRCGGNRLGPVGGRIVGEVLIGLLDLDAGSVRHAPGDWQPTATLAQLLTGVQPSA